MFVLTGKRSGKHEQTKRNGKYMKKIRMIQKSISDKSYMISKGTCNTFTCLTL